MPEVVSNTTPLQYLHQAGVLGVLPRIYGRIVVPTAVADELRVGREAGVDVPDPVSLDRIEIRPVEPSPWPVARDIHRGEAEVLALTGAAPVADADVAKHSSAAHGFEEREVGWVLIAASGWPPARPVDGAGGGAVREIRQLPHLLGGGHGPGRPAAFPGGPRKGAHHRGHGLPGWLAGLRSLSFSRRCRAGRTPVPGLKSSEATACFKGVHDPVRSAGGGRGMRLCRCGWVTSRPPR